MRSEIFVQLAVPATVEDAQIVRQGDIHPKLGQLNVIIFAQRVHTVDGVLLSAALVLRAGIRLLKRVFVLTVLKVHIRLVPEILIARVAQWANTSGSAKEGLAIA